MNAVGYAGLVGRYVDMSRPSTEEERSVPGGTDTVGMAGVIICVYDTMNGIAFLTDYGMSFEITTEHEPYWIFSIWSSEAEAGRR